MGKLIDLTGKKFGRLTVVERAGERNNGAVNWLCKCSCGGEIIVEGTQLRRSKTVSCGCYRKEKISIANKTHGLSKNKLYRKWGHIKERCYYEHNISYRHYGANHISMCPEWKNDFESFYNWSIDNGYEDGLTIERIDNSKGYSPDNCRWATVEEQNNNKGNVRMVTYQGKTQSIAKWSKELGFNYGTLNSRIVKYKWDVEKALTKPSKNLYTFNGESLTLKQWAKKLDIRYTTLEDRVYKLKWTIEQALTKPTKTTKK